MPSPANTRLLANERKHIVALNLNTDNILKAWIQEAARDILGMLRLLESPEDYCLLERCNCDKTLGYVLLRELEDEGYIDRNFDDGHIYVRLTEKGEAYCRDDF